MSSTQAPPDSNWARLGEEAYQHLAANTTFSPVGRWGVVAEAFLMRHLTILDLWCTHGVVSTMEKILAFEFHFFVYTPLKLPLAPHYSISSCFKKISPRRFLLALMPPSTTVAPNSSSSPGIPFNSSNANHLFLIYITRLISILYATFTFPILSRFLILRSFLAFSLSPSHTSSRVNQVIPFFTYD